MLRSIVNIFDSGSTLVLLQPCVSVVSSTLGVSLLDLIWAESWFQLWYTIQPQGLLTKSNWIWVLICAIRPEQFTVPLTVRNSFVHLTAAGVFWLAYQRAPSNLQRVENEAVGMLTNTKLRNRVTPALKPLYWLSYRLISGLLYQFLNVF